MARRERTPPPDGTRVPSAGFAHLNRAFVMASESLWRHFHAEWRAIEVRYPIFEVDLSAEERATMLSLRDSARDALRVEAKTGVELLGFSGPYLIPV